MFGRASSPSILEGRVMRYLAPAFGLILLTAGCEGPKADLSAADLRTAYRDVSKADPLYKDRTFAVSGTVKWVGDTMVTSAGSRTVYLAGGADDKEIAVVCNFPPASAAQAERLREGQRVVIRGVCRGDLWREGVPTLSECVVAR
jgi:hypothetical protein